MGIKNANIRKWTDAVDRTLLDHYISIFRGLTKSLFLYCFSGIFISSLCISNEEYNGAFAQLDKHAFFESKANSIVNVFAEFSLVIRRGED